MSDSKVDAAAEGIAQLERQVELSDFGALATAIRRRATAALAGAEHHARRVVEGGAGDFGAQSSLESSLDDLARYSGLMEHLATRVRVLREPLTYRPDDHTRSFFHDLIRARVLGEQDAQDRLRRHASEMRFELRARRAAQRDRFGRTVGALGAEVRDISRTDGAGGEFVPPLHLVDRFSSVARASRVFAELCQPLPLPPATDSINVPRLTTGGAVAAQTADNAAITEQDLVSTSVALPVRTLAGFLDASIQLLDQTPGGFDLVAYKELSEDYDAKLAAQTINGSGASGQLQGILGVSGIASVTWTDATPTYPELQVKIADAASQAAAARQLPPTAVLLAPRRWYWATAALDASNLPLVPPSQAAPPPADDQAIGAMVGLRSYIDAGVPLTLGAGSNEDRVIVTRPLDHLLFESEPMMVVAPDPNSGILGVRLHLRRYVAFSAALWPSATAVVSGTGLAGAAF